MYHVQAEHNDGAGNLTPVTLFLKPVEAIVTQENHNASTSHTDRRPLTTTTVYEILVVDGMQLKGD